MSKRKLLLADDSVTIQKVVNLTFADEGIEVIAVGDGDSAMEKLAEITPDLVMADVNMPGLNGYQVCEKIRQNAMLRHTPVILLVGSFEPYDEEEARRVGADDFLTKPFQSIRQLVNKVTVLLDLDRAPENENQMPAPANSSFEETLKMGGFEEIEEPVSAAPQFDDIGFDDEMIQTSQVHSYVLDESQKFETREAIQPTEDFAQTQPLTTQEMKEFDFAYATDETVEEEVIQSTESEIRVAEPIESMAQVALETPELPAESAVEEIETTEDLAEETEATETTAEDLTETTTEDLTETTESMAELAELAEATVEVKTEIEDETIPLPEVASILHLDEINLLELPPIEFNGESEDQKIEPGSEAQSGAAFKTDEAQQISSDLIEAITQKVLERLSEKAVTEVAWEVVPQMTELIVKKMAEDKMKD